MKSVKVGILGAAGYTGGELIRLLLNHPQVEIVFSNSESNAGNPVSEVHEGLLGETDLCFTAEMPFDKVDVVFFCFGHGKSAQFLREHEIPEGVKIIDMAQDFRIKSEGLRVKDYNFIYGLPETHRDIIVGCQHLANPGCFATCIQLAMLPALKAGIISGDIHVNGITGSTGAGQKPGATTHFSWRNDNISVYKTFTHQHLLEINQTVQELCPGYGGRVLFIPQRGCFTRGIFVTSYAKCDRPIEEVQRIYADYYRDAAFTHFVLKSPDMKQVVNTNKALVYVERYEDQLLMISCIDNLLKGAVGQAVQNMNLMFGLDERTGLQLKASAF
ncbi:MAG: N-acetyl-gamma-glutamyl-phosphate reductase [Bacteroidaceae bacterium]|nr:N-acetyl-gamma-glutamyl-phosphate reductase [Bacteroidaceae bacterium]